MKIIEIQKNPKKIREFYKTMMLSYAKHTLSFKEFQEEVKNESVHLLTISINNKIVATCSFFVEKVDSNNRPYYGSIHRVTVDPKFRGQGLGIEINKIALDFGKQLGCKYVYCSALINVKGLKTGGLPNLGQLNICINKLGYVPVGFRLLDLPDFDNKKDKQFTSTVVLWKPLGIIKDNKNYILAKENLFLAYNSKPRSKLIINRKIIKPYIISYKKTGAKLVGLGNIHCFEGTDLLPSYFLPFYGKRHDTVYFAFKYGTVLTDAKKNNSNITGVSYKLLRSIISDSEWIDLLKNIQKGIIQNSSIQYAE